MSDQSSIEWTDATWNPVRGCTKVSPGCAHCYAETFAERFRGVPSHPYEQGFDLRLVPDKLAEPLSWKKPRRVFVNSMSDLFQDGVPFEYVDRVFAVMALTPQHTYQILTKRSERMREYIRSRTAHDGISTGEIAGIARSNGLRGLAEKQPEWVTAGRLMPWPLPNVWLGCSVENQHFADERIPLLLQTPASVRFISAEPLLGPVNLSDIQPGRGEREKAPLQPIEGWSKYLALKGQRETTLFGYDCPKLDWVIVGGESGHGARPFDLAWARSIVDQCKGAGVACFVKQLGAKAIDTEVTSLRDGYCQRAIDGVFLPRLKQSKGGDMAEWPADLRVRQFPV